jgi:hypothetical protein
LGAPARRVHDKLIDELAKGKAMAKILRQAVSTPAAAAGVPPGVI